VDSLKPYVLSGGIETLTMKNTVLTGMTIIISVVVAILLSNLIYLSGYIDFYKPELLANNLIADLSGQNKKNTVLIMGDSFTAGNNSYPNILRNILPNYRIINSGIPGSGIIQASIIAKRRIDEFNPNIFIYQIYVGNDLLDISYPVNWRSLSFMRNMYWLASNHIRIISFLNYRLGQLNASNNEIYQNPTNKTIDEKENFSIDRFTKREIIYNIADDKLIENSIRLKGSRIDDFKLLLSKLEEIFTFLPASCKKYIVLIPHASQIDLEYLNRTIEIRANFSDTDKILEEEYPFARKIKEVFPEIRVLNPLALFKNAEANGIKVYYANDGHLNNNGQRLLADFLAKYLKNGPE
jgi:hypothetical protein